MVNSSILISFFKALYNAFSKSITYKVVEAVVNFVSALLGGTFFMRIMKAAGKELGRESSYFYNLIKSIWRGICAFVKNVFTLGKDGIFFRGIRFLFGSSFIFNPYNFFLLGIFAVFVCPHEIWNNAFGLLFAAALVVFYFIAFVKGEKVGVNSNRIWLPFILFAGAVILSVLVSFNVSDSIRVLMFFVTAFVLCIVTFSFVSTAERFDKICAVVFFALIITGVVAVAQKVLGIEVDELLTDVELNGNMPGRAFSTWANPNNFAEFLIIFFPFCFSFAVTRKDIKWKTASLLALLIPFAALLFTYSRSGWLGFAVTVITFVILYNKKMLPAIVIVGILMIPLLPSSIMDRIMTIGNLEDTSSSYRIDIWTGAIKMIKTFWYSGVGLGPGAFAEIYPSFAVKISAEAPHTHMLFMEVWAEMGIIGILSFAVFIICLVARGCTAAKKCENGKMKLYSISAASAMMGILTIGFAEYVWFYPRVMFAFFVAIGMAMAAEKLAISKNS